MMRAALWLLLPVMMAQTVPMDVRPGGQAGTVQFTVPGTAVPLVAEGAEWVCTLDIVYRVMGGNGQILNEAKETIPVRLSAAQRQAAMAQPLGLTRPLPAHPEAVEFRVEMTARPAGVTFAGGMPVATFQAESNVALVPFQVEVKKGQMAGDLKDSDVVVMEDGKERKASVYALGRHRAEMMPVDITLLFDRSGSMRAGGGSDPEIFRKELLEEFPNARVAIYGFSDQLIQFTGHTRDLAALQKAASMLNSVPPRGTPLYWAVAETIRRFDRKRAAVRILAVFSDGIDGGSDVQFAGAMREAQRAGVAIYPVVVARPAAARRPPAPVRKKKGRDVTNAPSQLPAMMDAASLEMEFRRLANSGGQDMTALQSANSVATLLREMTKKMRNGYVAAYVPAAGEHKAQVVLRNQAMGAVIGGARTVVR